MWLSGLWVAHRGVSVGVDVKVIGSWEGVQAMLGAAIVQYILIVYINDDNFLNIYIYNSNNIIFSRNLFFFFNLFLSTII